MIKLDAGLMQKKRWRMAQFKREGAGIWPTTPLQSAQAMGAVGAAAVQRGVLVGFTAGLAGGLGTGWLQLTSV